MPTEIKSDATGEEVFEGTVGRIYPTAVKASDGSTRTDGGVEFETEVSINDPASTGLARRHERPPQHRHAEEGERLGRPV